MLLLWLLLLNQLWGNLLGYVLKKVDRAGRQARTGQGSRHVEVLVKLAQLIVERVSRVANLKRVAGCSLRRHVVARSRLNDRGFAVYLSDGVRAVHLSAVLVKQVALAYDVLLGHVVQNAGGFGNANPLPGLSVVNTVRVVSSTAGTGAYKLVAVFVVKGCVEVVLVHLVDNVLIPDLYLLWGAVVVVHGLLI